MTVPLTSKYHASASPQPWIEKYRPKTMDDVAAQAEVVHMLKRSIETGNLPHLLFYGPPGTGKTSTILALARDLFGEHFRERVLELNASDERGIAVIRNKVKNFARTVVSSTSSSSSSSHTLSESSKPLPAYKLIILDEADSMTYDAQAALRRTIENYSTTTRFCIICNYVHRIIDPLGSRCAKFRFKTISLEQAAKRLSFICQQEGAYCSNETIHYLNEFTDGDLRKSINYLQSAYRLSLASNPGMDKVQISLNTLNELTGRLPETCMDHYFEHSCQGVDKADQYIQKLVQEGYSITQFITQLHHWLIHPSQQSRLTHIQKSLISMKLGPVLKCCLDGADGQLQLLDLAAHIYKVIHCTSTFDISSI